MKSILFIPFFLFGLIVHATEYYVAESGNDQNSGLSKSAPWRSLDKVSSMNFVPGDRIFFKRGDVFYGQLIISSSGTPGNPIIYGDYGEGQKPVISGFTHVNTWRNMGKNIWESLNPVKTAISPLNLVVINNSIAQIGRYPNTGWLTYQSSTEFTKKSSSLNAGETNWTGAIIVSRKHNWVTDNDTILSHSGQTITHSYAAIGVSYAGRPNYGFFIQNDIRTLDVQNEWYFNPVTKKLNLYSIGTPQNVQVATIDTLVYLKYKNDIIFKNLNIVGANEKAMAIFSSANVTVENVDFEFAYNSIVGDKNYGRPSSNFKFQNSTINHTLNNAIYLQTEFTGSVINNVKINNTGLRIGMGGSQDEQYNAIRINAANSLVENCMIDSVGYVGIGFYGNNFTVRRNIVKNFCLVKMDGAGIYTFVDDGGIPFNGQKVIDNIVYNGYGDNSGTTDPAPLAHGIYLDEGTSNVEVARNLSFNNSYSGLYYHSSYNNNVHDNIFYNNNIVQLLALTDNTFDNERNFKFKNNVLVSRTINQLVARFYSYTDDIKLWSNSLKTNNNYYIRPLDDSLTILSQSGRNNEPQKHTLQSWINYSKYDVDSKKSPLRLLDPNNILFEYNDTYLPKMINLADNYVDLDGHYVDKSITLSPFTGIVLLRPEIMVEENIKGIGFNFDVIADPQINITASSVTNNTLDNNHVFYSSGYGNTSKSLSIDNGLPVDGRLISTSGASYQLEPFNANNTIKIIGNGPGQNFDLINPKEYGKINLAYSGVGGNSSVTYTVLYEDNYIQTGSFASRDWSCKNCDKYVIKGLTRINRGSNTLSGDSFAIYEHELLTDITKKIKSVSFFSNGGNGTSTNIFAITGYLNEKSTGIPNWNAGSDKVLYLPENTIVLEANGIIFNETILGFSWTKKSGPEVFNIVNAHSPVTEVTGLEVGVYVFELAVIDINGVTKTSSVQITVKNGPNKAPLANAGADKVITLPINMVSLTGNGTDEDGTITNYQWSKKSGPVNYQFVNSSSAVTAVTGLVKGVYIFELTVTDNEGATATSSVKVTVNAAPNKAPISNAGANKVITLPTNAVSLTGSGTDEDGSIIKYQWAKKSGPVNYQFVNAASAVTDVSGLVQGVYVFELMVTDNNEATATSSVQVTVNAATNKAPISNAGANKVINLPANVVSLTGSGTDEDGTIVKYQWSKKSGPVNYQFVNASSAVTNVSGLVQGVYIFELIVTDNGGATATSSVQITVNAAANKAPISNAGANKVITLPANVVSLTGSGTDEDGTIVKYQWSKKSGPVNYQFVNSASAVTDVSRLIEGVYVFELTVTDNSGATATSSVQVTVNAAASKAPISHAGADKVITLPTNKLSLMGSGTVEDGTIIDYLWTRKSGPISFSFVNARSPLTEVSGLTEGVYVFELKVTNNGGVSAVSTVTVTVLPNKVALKNPVADAGGDITITEPFDEVTLNGKGIAINGAITEINWIQISGPSISNIVSAQSFTSIVNRLVPGTYEFELTVGDNLGRVGKDTVKVVVALGRLSQAESNSFKIYPNPVIDVAILDITSVNSNAEVSLRISDVNGRVMIKKPIAASGYNFKERIDLSNLIKGVYTVTIEFNEVDIIAHKILKK